MAASHGSGPARTRRSRTYSAANLDRLIEEAIVDAYGESEQTVGFYTMLEDHLTVPFVANVLGVEVTVEAVDLTEDERIVAVCRRGRSRQRIGILDLPIPPPDGAEWIEAYRRWFRGVSNDEK